MPHDDDPFGFGRIIGGPSGGGGGFGFNRLIGGQDEEEQELGVLGQATNLATAPLRAGAALFRTIIKDPFIELKEFVEQEFKGAVWQFKNGRLNPVGVHRARLAAGDISPEDFEKSKRGFATFAGIVASGGVGGVVRTMGARALETQIGKQLAGRVAIRGAQGATEGAVFGGVFGSIRPLSEDETYRSDAMLTDFTAGAIFGGLLGGLGPIAARGKDKILGPKITDLPFDKRREITNVLAKAMMEGEGARFGFARGDTRQAIMDAGTDAAEFVAQSAAGRGDSAVQKGFFMKRLVDNISTAAAFATKRWAFIEKTNPDLKQAAVSLLSSRVVGQYFGRRFWQLIAAGSTKDEMTALGRIMWAARPLGVARVNREMAEQAANLLTLETLPRTGSVAGMDPVKVKELQKALRTLQAKATEFEEYANLFFQPADRALMKTPRMQQMLTLVAEGPAALSRHWYGRNGGEMIAKSGLVGVEHINLQRATAQDIKMGRAWIPGINAWRQAKKEVLDPKGEFAKIIKQEGLDVDEMIVEHARNLAEERLLGGRLTKKDAGATRLRVTRKAKETPYALRAEFNAPAYLVDAEEVIARNLGTAFAVDSQNNLATVLLTSYKVAAPGRKVAENERLVPIRGNPQVIMERLGIDLDAATPAELGALMEQAGITKFGQVAKSIYDPDDYGALGRLEPVLNQSLIVPKEVARMVREIEVDPFRTLGKLDVDEQTIMRGWARFMDFSVSMLLASSVEVVAHSNRILGVLSRMPLFAGGQAGLASTLIPVFGSRLGGLRAMYRVYDDPVGVAMAQRIASVGGQSGRFMETVKSAVFPEETTIRFSVGHAVGKKFPKLGELLEEGRNFLFGLGEFGGRGLYGFDERARVVGALAAENLMLKHAGRKLTDAELRVVVEGFGQYNAVLQSNLVNELRRLRLNPFAGGQSGLIVREIQQLFLGTGMPQELANAMTQASIRKMKTEIMWRGVVGSAAILTVAQFAWTKSFPWENEKGHKGDVRVGYLPDGRAVYVPLTSIVPELARAMNITGMRTVVEQVGSGFSLSEAAVETMRRAANTVIGYGINAPGLQTATTLALGRAPFITGGGELLEVVPPQPSHGAQIAAQAYQAAGSLNPTFEELFGFGHGGGGIPQSIRIINALTTGMKVGRQPVLAQTSDIRQERSRLYDVARSRTMRALDEHPDDFGVRVGIYQQEARRFADPAAQVAALQAMIRFDVQTQRSRGRNLQRALIGEAFP